MSSKTKQAMLEIAVNAVFGKHDLSGFEVVDAAVGMRWRGSWPEEMLNLSRGEDLL